MIFDRKDRKSLTKLYVYTDSEAFLLNQISGSEHNPRVPASLGEVSVNSCAFPECTNFGIPATQERNDPNYVISGTGKSTAAIRCRECGRHVSIKSNIAVHEEIERQQFKAQLSTVIRQDGLGCNNTECESFGLQIDSAPTNYRKVGYTDKGNPRMQCMSCNRTFTVGSSKRKNHPENHSYKNEMTFRLLVNQMPINRIIEMVGLSPPAIYKKIDMFFERCLHFVAERESHLKYMDLKKLILSTDRQDYTCNWTQRKDKRNVIVSGIGTADKASRYVFGMEVNYDPDIDLMALHENDLYLADEELKAFNRNFARIWTPRDYGIDKRSNQNLPSEAIDSDDSKVITGSTKLPSKGTLVRSEYTMLAHFYRLEKLIGHADELRFFLDQDGGLDRALCNAFSRQVLENRCHAMFVNIDKFKSVDQRRELVRHTQYDIGELIMEGIATDEFDAMRKIASYGLSKPESRGSSKHIWYPVDVHKIFEVNKAVAFITEQPFFDRDFTINMMLQSTLHPIDNFFQISRRRTSILERPTSTPSNNGRTWTGKQPYNPATVTKRLTILRTFYNYCLKGKDGKTPAQRLGLARGAVEIRKILYP